MQKIKRVMWGLVLGLTAWWLWVDPLLTASPAFFAVRNSLVNYTGILGMGMMSVGMLQVFDAMAFSRGGDTRAMADGISHAMIATMAGLVVSVIGLFFSNLFASRVRVEAERLHDLIAPG